jgi:hypothetical protein
MLCLPASAAVGALVGATVTTGSAVAAAVTATVGVSVSPGVGAARSTKTVSKHSTPMHVYSNYTLMSTSINLERAHDSRAHNNV